MSHRLRLMTPIARVRRGHFPLADSAKGKKAIYRACLRTAPARAPVCSPFSTLTTPFTTVAL